MVFYKLDYTIGKISSNFPTPEQNFLKKYLNADFPQAEAKYLWERIVDHKWYVSERLKRDVGFRVAAIDYVGSFYEPLGSRKRQRNSESSIRQFLKLIWRMEFLRPNSL